MGDMADDAFDRAMDEMLDPDFDYDYVPQGRYSYGFTPGCQFCKKKSVYWQRTANGYRLFNTFDLTMHMCKDETNRNTEGFDDVE